MTGKDLWLGQIQSQTWRLHCLLGSSNTLLQGIEKQREREISTVPGCCVVLATLSAPVPRQSHTDLSQLAELPELEAQQPVVQSRGTHLPVGCTEKRQGSAEPSPCRRVQRGAPTCSGGSRQGRGALARQLLQTLRGLSEEGGREPPHRSDNSLCLAPPRQHCKLS